MNPITVVLRKEALDGIRDKRAVMSAMIFPLLAPVLVLFMLNMIINIRSEAVESVIPIQGMENAPVLVQWLKEHNVKVEAFDGDAEQAVISKDKELVLVIPENYNERMQKTRTAAVELVNDGSRTDARATVGRIRGLIRRYNSEVASLRLIARGVSPEVIRAVDVQNIEVASKQQLTAGALNFIPFYIILAGFISGMGLAVDSTAGERERKSIEPLLINPVARHDIVIGKWIAAGSFAAFGMIATLILCLLAMNHVPLEKLGLTFQIRPEQTAGMIAATLPLAFLATSLQLFLGIFAKSFKDAQSYIGLVTFLPMIPFFMTVFSPIATKAWMYGVPLLSQHLMLVDVMGGEAVPLYAFFVAAISTFVVSLALVLVTARLFSRESIISG